VRRWIALAALLALLLAAHFAGLTQHLSFEALRDNRAALLARVAANPALAALAFVAAYVAAVALSLPGAVWLTLAGGFLFGAALGTALTVLAATAGAVLVFLAAGWFLAAEGGERALARFGARGAKLAEAIRREGFLYLLALRLVPLFPFFLVNLVPALVGMRLGPYALATALGIVPATAVFSLAGAGLGRALEAEDGFDLRAVLSAEALLALGGLALLSLLTIPLKRRMTGARGGG
jgi:uncharacterized membrane protein YdjX (TVP38/TMEM64 family)